MVGWVSEDVCPNREQAITAGKNTLLITSLLI
jgi:hypothetical protein